jgi:hypothetical protein
MDGTTLAPDGSLTGGVWVDVGMQDALLEAACQRG